MKSLKKSIILIILFVSISTSASAISGYGCNLGTRIYTHKLGTTTFWGTSYDVYNSTGTNYLIDWNNKSKCNNIDANDIISQNKGCWVNSYVNPTNNSSGVSYGTLVLYTVEPCTPQNLPLDDYLLYLLITIGIIGVYALRKKEMS